VPQANLTPRQREAARLSLAGLRIFEIGRTMGISRQAALVLVQRAGVWLPAPKCGLCPCCHRPAKLHGWCPAAWSRYLRNGTFWKKPRICESCGEVPRKWIKRRWCERCAYREDPETKQRRIAYNLKHRAKRAAARLPTRSDSPGVPA